MNKKIVYSDESINAKVVDDFLPSPENLVFNDKKVKVTISLSENSIEFFKAEAKKNGTNYQKMIRNLLDMYASKYQASW